jgi:hypothetical protein
MSYSELYTEQKSRPSQILIALALFATVSAAGYYFLTRTTTTRASKQVIKKHQQVNIAPRQAGVFWEVNSPDEGWVIYGENPSKLDQIALDDRDISKRESRPFHLVMMKNLNPETTYYYKIISNEELVSAENNEPFSIRTISESVSSASLSPAYGKVVSSSGDALANNVVVVTINNAYPLMTFTKNTGEWLIPLQYIINSIDQRSVSLTEDTIVNIRIFNDSQQSIIKATLSQTHPLPQTVIMGTNYTFLENKVLGTSDQQKKNDLSYDVDLLYPKNGAVIPGNTPLVKGKGIPDQVVSIQINSKPEIQGKTKVDKDGRWSITLGRTIQPGTYTLTMNTIDSRNRGVEIKHNFTLIKSGEQVLAESTTSASITPTQGVTPSSVISPTPTSAVIAEEPTPTEEVIITDLSPTLTPAPPVTGISFIPFMFAGIGFVLLGAGLVLFL